MANKGIARIVAVLTAITSLIRLLTQRAHLRLRTGIVSQATILVPTLLFLAVLTAVPDSGFGGELFGLHVGPIFW